MNNRILAIYHLQTKILADECQSQEDMDRLMERGKLYLRTLKTYNHVQPNAPLSCFALTVWAEEASVLIGVISDDADAINLHKLSSWGRFAA